MCSRQIWTLSKLRVPNGSVRANILNNLNALILRNVERLGKRFVAINFSKKKTVVSQ